MRKIFLIGMVLCSLPGRASAAEVAFERDLRIPLTHIHVVVRAGSAQDPKDQKGLTQFLGELMLRGTATRNRDQLNAALDNLGAQLEVETGINALIFRGSVLTEKVDQFNEFQKILEEVLTQPSFSQKEFDILKAETISLLQEELGHDSALALRAFQRHLFQNHPYGNPVLGTIRDVQSFTRSAIENHYNRIVRDSNFLIVGNGNIEQSVTKKWARRLGELRPDIELAETDKRLLEDVPPPQNAKSRRLLIVDKPDRTQTQINLGQIGIKMTDSNFFPLYLGNYVFGGPSFSSVLMKEVREKRGWSYGANSVFRHGTQPRSWHIHLFPAAKDTPSALALTLQLAEELKKNGVSKEKFEFSRRSLVNKAGFMFNTAKKRVENTVLEKTLNLPDGFMKTFGPRLSELNQDQVNQALTDFLKPEQFAITVLGTAKDLKAPLARAAGIPEDKVEVLPYTSEF